MIRVIIADDQLLFRSMLEEMLKKDVDVDLVAACGNGEETVVQATLHKPDIVLLDIQMPIKSGLEALRDIKSGVPGTKVIMLTTFETDENIAEALRLGAEGYLLKELKPEILLMAIKCVAHDIMLFHRSVYRTLLLQNTMTAKVAPQRIEFGDLVFDQIDISIMKLIALGKTNRDIAVALNYSEGTIKNRVSKILASTGFSDRTEISVFALKNQII